MATPKAFIFDAYGTLFDVHSVVEAGRALTRDPQALSLLWRQKQLEYTWLRTLMGRYEDFWAVTEAALRFALGRLGIVAGDEAVARLMEAYLSLATFPDVAGALAGLADASRHPVERLAAHARRRGAFERARRHLSPRPVGGCRQGLQAFAHGLRARPSGFRSAGRRYPLRVVERVGRGRSQGLRLPHLLVQPSRRAHGSARRLAGLRGQDARRDSGEAGLGTGGAASARL